MANIAKQKQLLKLFNYCNLFTWGNINYGGFYKIFIKYTYRIISCIYRTSQFKIMFLSINHFILYKPLLSPHIKFYIISYFLNLLATVLCVTPKALPAALKLP